eukprot:3283520-Amphidinium_carterae.1
MSEQGFQDFVTLDERMRLEDVAISEKPVDGSKRINMDLTKHRSGGRSKQAEQDCLDVVKPGVETEAETVMPEVSTAGLATEAPAASRQTMQTAGHTVKTCTSAL